MVKNLLEDKMAHFTNAVKKSLENENWYSALLVTLTLPDICGYLDNQKEKSGPRYVKWFNSYMKPKYTKYIGASKEKHVYLNGNDAYALRCSYLHSGSFHTDEQWIRDALNKFRFVTVSKGSNIHRNQRDTVLQLQVDEFCLEMCEAVDEWVILRKSNADIVRLSKTMIEIEHIDNKFTL